MIERVKQIIELKARNVSDFARMVGMPQTSMNDYVKGYKKPPLALAINVLNAFPDISAEWLMRGEGDMFRSQFPAVVVNNSNNVTRARNINTGNGVVNDHVSNTTANNTELMQQLIAQNAKLTERLLKLTDSHE